MLPDSDCQAILTLQWEGGNSDYHHSSNHTCALPPSEHLLMLAQRRQDLAPLKVDSNRALN